MPLTPEQVQELKEQLKQQVQHLPEQQRQAAELQIENMSAETIETMLKQQQSREGQKTIFRMIADKEVSAHQVEENDAAIAVLDINPISRGHTLVIPKQSVADITSMPPSALELAKKAASLIKEKLAAKEAEIQPEKKFGEVIIHIIPIYDAPLSLSSPRQKASESELEQTLAKIKEQKPEVIKIVKDSTEQAVQLPRRIP